MSRNMYKIASSINRIKSNIRRNQENYIHWKYLKSHGKRLASISLDLYLGLMEWTL